MPNDCSPGMGQQAADIGLLNFKLGYDEQLDDRRTFRDIAQRRAQNAATFDKAIDAITALAVAAGQLSTQAGSTEAQQAVSPIRTGVGDTLASASYPANRTIDTASAGTAVAAEGVATANQALADALATAVSFFNQGLAALSAVLVTAAGGASTPSQTTPKS